MSSEQDYLNGLEGQYNISDVKKLSDIEHVLQAPAVYIGSMQFKYEQEIERYNVSDARPISREYDAILCDGLNTMFNELINNSYDVHVRNIRDNNQRVLSHISMTVDSEKGMLSCWDNGGIPVVKHPQYDEWLPQIFFGHLRSGSNYKKNRGNVAGVNGVGASLVNVLSKQFKVITAFNGLKFECTWHDNMSRYDEPIISKCSKKENFTYIEAHLDLARWQYEDSPLVCIPDDTVDKWLSRAIEVAVMGCDPKSPLTVEWHDKTRDKDYSFAFKHFWEYKDLWQHTEEFRGDENANYAFEIGPSFSGAFESFAIVNSIRCDYGTHMDFIANICADYIAEHLKSKHNIDITDKRNWKQGVFSELAIMSMWQIPDASFDAQIKDKLATPTKHFGFNIDISDKLKKHLTSTGIVKRLVEEHTMRKRIEEETAKRKQQKAMNEQLTVKTKQFFVDKLVDASAKNDRHQCELLIVEGDSASQGLRTNRTSLTQGFYCLKGKSLGNTFYLQPQDILKKEVLVGLMKSLGLKFGQKATKQNLRYGRISILTDADVDGDQIAAMLALFFYKFWPELYTDGIIVRMITPILVCSKDNHKLYFYTDKEFSEHEEKLNASNYAISYKKGLASLTSHEFSDMMRGPIYEQLYFTDETATSFKAWFGDDADLRKQLMGISKELYYN